MKKEAATKNLAIIALLIALNVVLSRFLSVNTTSLKIGFTFLTVMMAAYFFGAIGSMTVAGVADVIGALLFPVGPFFPGFTLTAVLTGLCYGLLMNKNITLVKISVAVLLSQFLGSGIVNTFWISYMYHSDFKTVLVTRLITQILPMIAVEIIAGYLLFCKSKSMKKVYSMIKR